MGHLALERLVTFRGEYGRLCILVTQAFRNGHDEAQVLQAALGEGNRPHPVYVKLRRQGNRTKRALQACHDIDVPDDDIVRVGYEARRAVEKEWNLKLPPFREAA